jgi:hypothetical protein
MGVLMQQGGISDVMDSCKTIIQVLLANILFPVFYGFPLDLGVCCFFSLLLALNLFLVSHVSTQLKKKKKKKKCLPVPCCTLR